MSGDRPLFYLHAFMEWTEKILLSYHPCYYLLPIFGLKYRRFKFGHYVHCLPRAALEFLVFVNSGQVNTSFSRSQWPRSLRLRSSAQRLLGSWVRIPPGAWISVSCTVFVMSGRGLCDGPIPRPEESYRLWCVSECDQVKINNLDTYCE
jgi:hypothetical protein